MKQSILLALMLFTINAYATDRTPTASAGAVGLGISNANSDAKASASASNGVNVDNDTKMPASSAISPSVGTASDCQIATPSSKAISILLISVSGTTGVTYNDICFAYKMGQFDVAEQLMCNQSADYKKANARCAK